MKKEKEKEKKRRCVNINYFQFSIPHNYYAHTKRRRANTVGSLQGRT